MGDLLITGFGAFDKFEVNPSEVLVDSIRDHPTSVIRVSYSAARAFVEGQIPAAVDRWLILGVGGAADRMRVERTARNTVGSTPDVDGVSLPPGPIDPTGEATLDSPLFATWRHRTRAWKPSSNAGKYLCNFVYFLALSRRPDVRSGFVHVPPFEAVALEVQRTYLSRILTRLENEG